MLQAVRLGDPAEPPPAAGSSSLAPQRAAPDSCKRLPAAVAALA